MNDLPTYSGAASESSGRTRDHAPSAPTSRLVVRVVPSAKATSWRPSPRARTPLTLCPHRTAPTGSESSRIRRSSPRCTSGDDGGPYYRGDHDDPDAYGEDGYDADHADRAGPEPDPHGTFAALVRVRQSRVRPRTASGRARQATPHRRVRSGWSGPDRVVIRQY